MQARPMSSCVMPMRWANATVTEKLNIGVVKFYNHGVVQAIIGICA